MKYRIFIDWSVADDAHVPEAPGCIVSFSPSREESLAGRLYHAS
jgi:hypothetical protein